MRKIKEKSGEGWGMEGNGGDGRGRSGNRWGNSGEGWEGLGKEDKGGKREE